MEGWGSWTDPYLEDEPPDDPYFEDEPVFFTGTVASWVMAYRKWNRVYVRAGKNKSHGVVM